MTDEQAGQEGETGRLGAETEPVANPGGRVIAGRYALDRELGRGGMGVVWCARDEVIGREVAVKELRLSEGGEDAGVFAERVLREVRTGGRLNDPAVVTVFDVITEAGTTYIVMELVEAPTLAQLVRRHGAMPAGWVASIGEQVLAALRAAHQAGIVHRDVKPANIMVGSDGRVKLTDFGIAQAVDDPRLTTSGTIVGSPAFMAPERVAGRDALPASDLWSLGATLFFAVEGDMPFERATTAATLHAIMHEVPYLTRAQGPLASAIMGLLTTNPQGRITAEQASGLLATTRAQAAAASARGEQGTASYPGGQPTAGLHVPAAGGSAARQGFTLRRKLATAGIATVAIALLAAGATIGHWVGSPSEDPAALETLTRGIDGTNGDIQLSYDSGTIGGGGICGIGQIERGREISGDNQPDCDEPHDFEIYDAVLAISGEQWNFDADERSDYPGEEALARYGEQRCALGFHSNSVIEEYQGQPKEEVLSYRAMIPTEEEWQRTDEEGEPDGFHWVVCAVTHREGEQLQDQVSRSVE